MFFSLLLWRELAALGSELSYSLVVGRGDSVTLRIRVRPNVAILAPRSQPYAFSFLRFRVFRGCFRCFRATFLGLSVCWGLLLCSGAVHCVKF